MSKSIAISPFTMPAALAAADAVLGSPRTWTGDPGNPEQSAWLETFRQRAAAASGMPEVHSHATTQAADHVAWLQSEGWPAQITHGAPSDIFLAATLDVGGKWLTAGNAYRAVGIERVVLADGVRARGNPGRPIVEVATRSGSVFIFQQVDDAGLTSEAALAAHVERMCGERVAYGSETVHIDFPAIDLRARSAAAHMIGLRSGNNVVTQAAEQFRLELDEVGGRASAAAEVAVSRGLGPRTVRIDGPFVVAVKRAAGPSETMFAALCDRDCWSRPAVGRT